MITNGFAYVAFLFFFAGVVSTLERKYKDTTFFKYVPTPVILYFMCMVFATFDLWQKTEEELQEIGLPPPFWAFAWAGGQGLARFVLDHPRVVEGKRVLDFASGSGIVGIAAMKSQPCWRR